jgi:hypothetical protein
MNFIYWLIDLDSLNVQLLNSNFMLMQKVIEINSIKISNVATHQYRPRLFQYI